MMAQSALSVIEDFDHAELQAFFENNDMNHCSTIFNYEQFNGKAFLHMKEADALRWKKLLTLKELKDLVEFAIRVKQNPEGYLPSKRPVAGNVSLCRPFVNDAVIKQLNKKFSSNEGDKRTAVCIPKTLSDAGNKNMIQNAKITSEKNIPQKPPPPKPTRLCYDMKSTEPNSQIIGSRYFMNISREEAETALKDAAKDGAYLFRPSSKYHYALSVFFENDVHHFGITSDDQHKLQFELSEGVRFDSIEHMVKYFREHSTITTAKREMKLTVPFITRKN